jgi:GT2 family glycosyltransferase
MGQPKVVIIILNWNRGADTLQCLAALRHCVYSDRQIIVVDNASTDGSPDEIRARFPEVNLIQNQRNLGYAGGNNLGMKHALQRGADYVWLLNNDAVVEPDTLSELVAAGEKDKKVGLLSPVIYHYDSPQRIQSCGTRFDPRAFATDAITDLGVLATVPNAELCLWGTALLIKREVIERIGDLNEEFFAYVEDIDFSLRAIKAGYLNKTVLSSRVIHRAHKTSFENERVDSPQRIYYITRNEFWLWSGNLPFLRRVHYMARYFIRGLRNAFRYKRIGHIAGYEACLSGMMDAVRKKGGPRPGANMLPSQSGVANIPETQFKESTT